MGQAKIDVENKCLTIPQWFFFSRKIPLGGVQKESKVVSSGNNNSYSIVLSGDFGSETVNFNNYDEYSTFIYNYEKAMMAS